MTPFLNRSGILGFGKTCDPASAGPGFHLAFAAPSKQAVDQWHAYGLAHGAVDRGAPKIWDDFGPHYYAAYLTDPDGWQLEAVFKSD